MHTAIAYWEDDSVIAPDVHSINVSRKAKNLEEKLEDLCSQFSAYLSNSEHSIDNAAIEGVQVWHTNLTSMTAATRGDLSLLSYVVGIYAAECCALKIPVHIIPPQWKGQLNYDALAVWVERITGETYPTEHALAAVGIGLSLSRRLL